MSNVKMLAVRTVQLCKISVIMFSLIGFAKVEDTIVNVSDKCGVYNNDKIFLIFDNGFDSDSIEVIIEGEQVFCGTLVTDASTGFTGEIIEYSFQPKLEKSYVLKIKKRGSEIDISHNIILGYYALSINKRDSDFLLNYSNCSKTYD